MVSVIFRIVETIRPQKETIIVSSIVSTFSKCPGFREDFEALKFAKSHGPKSMVNTRRFAVASTKIKSKRFPGVYYRDSSEKKFNGKPDRAYYFIYRDQKGQKAFVTVGWLSQGFSEQVANDLRALKLAEVGRIKATSIVGTPAVPGVNHNELVPIHSEEKEPEVPKQPEVPQVLLLNDIAEYYFTWMEGEGKHVSRERSRYNKNIRDIIGWLSEKDVDKLIVRDFKADLLKRMAVDSAKKCLALCRQIYYHARDSGYIDSRNPFGREDGFKMPKPQNKCERYLEPDEVLYLMPILKRRSKVLHDMSFVSLYTGARSTEIFTIRGADIVPNGLYFWITAKGGKREKVMANQEVINILLGYNRRPSEYVFQTPSGAPFKEIPDIFRRVVEELGLSPKTKNVKHSKEIAIKKSIEEKQQDRRKKVWFHTLRHTFASWLAQSGTVTLHELRELLRHSSIQMTERYAHMIPGTINQQSSLIGDVVVNYYKQKMSKLAEKDTSMNNAMKDWLESEARQQLDEVV